MVDYITPMYKVSDAARASDSPVTTLRSHLQRGSYRIVGGRTAEVKGATALLTLCDTLAFAVASALCRAGVHPKRAFKAAICFAHFGHGPSGWVGESKDKTSLSRNPGQLYDPAKARTFLIHQPEIDPEEEMQARIVAVPHKGQNSLSNNLFDIDASHRTEAAIVLDLGPIVDRVFQALGMHPSEAVT